MASIPRSQRSAVGKTARMASQPQIDGSFLLKILNEGYHGPAWHGPALEQTLQGCTYAESQHRLAPGRNTIHELVLHAAYGKHIVRVRLTNDRRRFPRPMVRSWWPRVVDASEQGWNDDLRLLGSAHVELADTIANMSRAQFARRRPGKTRTLAEEALGLVLHDVYHAGQIALIRKVIAAG